jgi:ssDNA-binding replication factor A large subunit
LHLTGFSDFKVSSEILSQVKSDKIFHEILAKDVSPGHNIQVRGVIVRIFDTKFFKVCEVCGKRISEINECLEHGKVAGSRRALLSIVLDDGTETLRAVLFSEQIKKLLNENELEGDEFLKKRQELLGKELIFSGQARKNKIFDSIELFVEDVKEVDIDKLIEMLEKK